MDGTDFSEILATNVYKLFPFRSGNRVWFFILLKAYLCIIFLGFCLACMLNAIEGKKWIGTTSHFGWGVVAHGDTALDECFWYVFTTMHGINFGEFMARGVAGRLIAMFCCAIGYWFTIFMMSIVMISQLPGEKAPSLLGLTSRMVQALWPSYSVFLAVVLAVGSVVGPYISKDYEGGNKWPTGMYWAWTVVHRTPYGDIFPDTTFGYTVTVPIACMGVLYMPYALACIAVRCPTAAQHKELIGRLRSNPEQALGSGYVEPPEADGSPSGTLRDLVMRDGYVQELDSHDRSTRCRSGLAVCMLLTFTLFGIMFCGGSPAAVEQVVEQVVEHSLELDLPPGIRSSSDPVPPVVWTFWLHDYPLEGAALKNYDSLAITLDTTVQLVTPATLSLYNVTEWPFHEALQYLAPNHQLDYIRAYWMHHYGGGFIEIKERKTNSTWTGPIDYIGRNETFWFMGEPSTEAVTCDESNIKDAWCKELQFKSIRGSDIHLQYGDMDRGMSSWKSSSGPCCDKVMQFYGNNTGLWPNHGGYIVRKQTDLTRDYLTIIDEHLNAKLPVLKQHTPPAEACCMNEDMNYPLRLDELRGEILSVLLKEYADHIYFDRMLL